MVTTVIGFSGSAILRPRVKHFFKALPGTFAGFAETCAHNVADWQVRRIRNDLKRFEQ